MTTQRETPQEYWEKELETAQRKARAARGKKTIRKWNRRSQECRMYLRGLKREGMSE